MDELAIGSLIIRGVNCLLWVTVVVKILRHDRPVSRLARQLISLVLLFGMAVLFMGSTVPFGFPGDVARVLYTSFTAFAGLIALAILTTSDYP